MMIELGIAVAVCVLMLAVVGAPLGILIGLRGVWLAAAAPAFAITVVGLASVVAPWLGLRWSLLPVAGIALVIAAGIAVVRALLRRRSGPLDRVRSTGSGNGWLVVLALVVAGGVLGWRVLSVLDEPDAISQTFDNVFHLNAIRYILDTGVVSPLEIGQMTSPNGGVPFYPDVWHALAALIIQVTGVSVPIAINAQTIVIAAVVWPLSVLVIARQAAGTRPTVTVAAAVVAIAVPAFPLLLMDYGVLYPLQLAIALTPVSIAATLALADVGSRQGLALGWWVLIVCGVLPGVALAHPGGFVAWLALTVPIAAVVASRAWRRFSSIRGRVAVSATVVAYLGLGVILLVILRPPLPTRGWPIVMDVGTAVKNVLTVEIYYSGASLVAAAGVVLGIVWALRLRTESAFIAVTTWAIGAILFVVVTAGTWQTLRDALTGAWYNNWPRVAAVFVVALVPLAVLGLARSADAVWAVTRSLRGRGALPRVAVASAAALAIAAVVVVAHAPYTAASERAAFQFARTDTAALISADEWNLLERLDQHVPAGSVIAGNPYTGAGAAYALAERRVLMPHILMDVSDDMREINDHLNEADTRPEVCAAVDALDVGYVLDFGAREVHGGANVLPGLVDLEDSEAVRLVDAEGDARLYEVIACD